MNKPFSTFYNKLNTIIKKYTPVKQVSIRKVKQLKKHGLILKIGLFNNGDTDKYKFYRNKILALTRQSKEDYYHRYFKKNLLNTKKTLEGISELINREKTIYQTYLVFKMSHKQCYDI